MGLEGWFPLPLRFGHLSIRYLMRAPIAAAAAPRIKPSVISLTTFSTLRLILLFFPASIAFPPFFPRSDRIMPRYRVKVNEKRENNEITASFSCGFSLSVLHVSAAKVKAERKGTPAS